MNILNTEKDYYLTQLSKVHLNITDVCMGLGSYHLKKFSKELKVMTLIVLRQLRAVLSSPPPIPAGLAGVLQDWQESCRNPEDSAKLCQVGRAWQDWDRVQQDSC